jgi:molecular chaperone DnaJ
MADKRDYYEVLDIERDATQKQVKDAYRRLARKLHPDVNPDPEASEKFKEVGEAYSVLSDQDKRAQYDKFGHQAFQPGMGGQGGPGGFQGGMNIDIEDLFGGRGGGGGGFGDIFEDLFGAAMGGRARGPQARRGADLQFVLDLNLEDVANGLTKTLRYRRHVTCATCNGSGGAPGTQPATCPVCHGRGQVGQTRGFMTFTQACPRCHGTGQVNPVNCTECAGKGYIEKEESLQVKIPPGVDTNSKVRFEGMGEAGANSGPTGDLYVIARVLEHDFFVRKGDNLYCEIPINTYEAALGAKIRIPTLKGSTTVTIPAGVSTGEEITIKGKGIPHLRGWGTGDQIIKLKVITPSGLTKDQRNLFKQLADLDKSDVRKHLEVFTK